MPGSELLHPFFLRLEAGCGARGREVGSGLLVDGGRVPVDVGLGVPPDAEHLRVGIMRVRRGRVRPFLWLPIVAAPTGSGERESAERGGRRGIRGSRP